MRGLGDVRLSSRALVTGRGLSFWPFLPASTRGKPQGHHACLIACRHEAEIAGIDILGDVGALGHNGAKDSGDLGLGGAEAVKIAHRKTMVRRSGRINAASVQEGRHASRDASVVVEAIAPRRALRGAPSALRMAPIRLTRRIDQEGAGPASGAAAFIQGAPPTNCRTSRSTRWSLRGMDP